jgi:hypothetical protein
MDNYKIINRLANYLIRNEISSVESEMPDDSNNYDSYTGMTDPFSRGWNSSQLREINRIEKRIKNIQKILNHGVSVLGNFNSEVNGYNLYLTNRIHEFAINWLTNNDFIQKKLNHIVENRSKNLYDNYKLISWEERFEDHDFENAFEHYREEDLKSFGLENWEEVVGGIESIKNYSFKSKNLSASRFVIIE